MKGSGGVPPQQSKDSPPQDLQHGNGSQAQTSQQTASEANRQQSSHESGSSQNNTQQPLPQSRYNQGLYPELVSPEMKQMILAAEYAIQRNLSVGDERAAKNKTQRYLLNLCFFVTHHCPVDIAALSWAIEYAKSAVALTLEYFYETDPLKIPVQLSAQNIELSEIPLEQRKMPLPLRYEAVSDDSLPPSPTRKQKISLPNESGDSRPERPNQPPAPEDGRPQQNVLPQPDDGNYMPPLISLLTLTMASALNRGRNGAASQAFENNFHEISPRILFDEPNENDWKFVERWVNIFDLKAERYDEPIAWLVTRMITMNRSLIGL